MKVRIKATEDPGKLLENLEKRVEDIRQDEGFLEAEIKEEKADILDRTPGIDYYLKEGERYDGLKGRPVQEEATAELETEEDLARAAVATIQGYDLVVLDSDQRWKLKLLRRLNPGVVNLSRDSAPEFLGIEKTLREGTERKMIEIDLSEEEVERVNSFLRK